jgi:putative Mg2+ transporter-C (MgtC) family protein
MDELQQEWLKAFGDGSHLIRVLVRLVLALLVGGVVGLERQQEGKAAGMRTHMLVALGSTLFVLVAVGTDMNKADLSRVIQGIAAGLGFIGAGTILKLSEQHEIRGLTTAASIWLTAAAGAAVGIGLHWEAILGVFLAWFVLFFLGKAEHWLMAKESR